jgi:integrase
MAPADIPVQDATGITVVELMAAYLRHAQHYYRKHGKPTSEYKAIVAALRYTRSDYGRTPVVEFGPLALQKVMQHMVDEGLSRGVVNQNLGRIKRMFRWGVSQELFPAVEVVALTNGKKQQWSLDALLTVPGLAHGRTTARESQPVTPVDDSTIDATLPHLPEVVADMVRFQRYTGCRPDEVCQIRPLDVDRSGVVWTDRPESHKTEHRGRQRVIFVGPQTQDVLMRYLERVADEYCFRPSDSEKLRRAAAHARRRTPLSCGNFPGSNRSHKPQRSPRPRYDVNSYRRAIHRACDKAFPWPELGGRKLASLTDVEKAELAKWQSAHRWSPNRLRHTAATEIRKKFGLEAAQVVLGHATASVTQVYAERDLALAARVAREVG